MRNKIQKSKNTLQIDVEVFYFKEDETYIAYCPAFDLSTYGSSLEDAEQAFEEAIDLFIEECLDKGTLEKVLLNIGWTLRKMPKPVYDPPRFNIKTFEKMKAYESVKTENLQLPV